MQCQEPGEPIDAETASHVTLYGFTHCSGSEGSC